MQVILSHAMLEALFAKADARPGQIFSLLYAVEPEMYLHLEAGSNAAHYASCITVGYKHARKFRNDSKRNLFWTFGRWMDKDAMMHTLAKHFAKLSAGTLDV